DCRGRDTLRSAIVDAARARGLSRFIETPPSRPIPSQSLRQFVGESRKAQRLHARPAGAERTLFRLSRPGDDAHPQSGERRKDGYGARHFDYSDDSDEDTARSDQRGALGRRRRLLALVGRRRRGDGLRLAGAARHPIDTPHASREPVTNWRVKTRRGPQWRNPRDTAIPVPTLNDYLRSSGELAADLEYELLFNGQRIAANKITAADALGAPSRFEIHNLRRELLTDGANDIRVRRLSGRGPIYFSPQARFFSREEPITEAGNEIFVRRQYYKLAARPTLLKGYVYERELLGDGEAVASGERVEAVITIEAKNNYEYLLFED